MASMLLTIQHNGRVFSPPIMEGVTIEWERSGAAGKLTFTTIKSITEDMSFSEGDPVCFYYDNKPVFMGYVFTKKRSREQHIEVTCYDQLRYLKNKYTYVFENQPASRIIHLLCSDLNLRAGGVEYTEYVIPSVAEENKSAMDIILDVLEETLLNTGKMFVLYDNFGVIELSNCAKMVSTTLIMEETAENFDYSSTIDSETYNEIILYYKGEDNTTKLFTATNQSNINQWGTLRYFEEVKNPMIGETKVKSLLSLYNKKTRALKVSGAFGDISVRGGTLIPVKLGLGDVSVNNYMLVDKVVHNFENDHHTMDLTLEGYWVEDITDAVYSEYVVGEPSETTDDRASEAFTGDGSRGQGFRHMITITCINPNATFAGEYSIGWKQDGKFYTKESLKESTTITVDNRSPFTLSVVCAKDHDCDINVIKGDVIPLNTTRSSFDYNTNEVYDAKVYYVDDEKVSGAIELTLRWK